MEHELLHKGEIDFYGLKRALESFLESQKNITDYWSDKTSSDMLKFVTIQIVNGFQKYQELIERMEKCCENTV